MTVIEHLERFCGPIVEGWKTDPDSKEMLFQVVRLERGPIPDSVTFSTLGLSNLELRSAVSPKSIRQELVILVRNDAVPKNIQGILHQVGTEELARRFAYLRGDVIGPRGTLFANSKLTALYVSAPVYFPTEFSGVSTQNIGRVVFAWLVPITAEEADYVKKNGWSKFEEVATRENPDFMDLHRQSLIK